MLRKLGLLSTNIRGREQSDQESAIDGKIALAHEHNCAPITSTSAREVARISARCLDHPARSGFFLDFLVSLPPTGTSRKSLQLEMDDYELIKQLAKGGQGTTHVVCFISYTHTHTHKLT